MLILVLLHRSSLTCAHSLNQPVVYMQEILGPGESHELKDFEELGEVEVLCRADDVDHFVKLILLVAPDRSADVAG